MKKYNYDEILFGVLFFFVHFMIELICYRLLYNRYSSYVATYIAILYDFFAFVPQVLIGDFYNKHKNLNISIFGVCCFVISLFFINSINIVLYCMAIFILSIGNAILHITSALATISVCKKYIFPSALYVSGGAFGIFFGRMLSNVNCSIYFLFIPIILILIILFCTSKKWCKQDIYYVEFDIVSNITSPSFVILVVLIVVSVRSYMSFVIPTTWKDTVFDMMLLYFSLGIGKALGGLFCDLYGYKFTTVLSTILCIPFILMGNNKYLSLFGILLFSMNMSITYALSLSIFKQNPAVAFGLTTIALFIGIIPILFVPFNIFVEAKYYMLSYIILIVLSLLCFYFLNKVLKK